MRKADRDVNLLPIRGAELDRNMLAKGWGAQPDIYDHIQYRTVAHAQQFGLRERWCLKVQTPERAGALRTRVVVLHPAVVDTGVAKNGVPKRFGKEASLVAVLAGRDDLNIRNVSVDDVHGIRSLSQSFVGTTRSLATVSTLRARLRKRDLCSTLRRVSGRQVLFIADQFDDSARSDTDGYVGGAERTDAAILGACPFVLTARAAEDVDVKLLRAADLIVIGNWTDPDPTLVDELFRLRKHILFEHDVRICQWRGNFLASKDYVHQKYQLCWCSKLQVERLVASAVGTVFLTDRQRAVYQKSPFFESGQTAVLGCSVFDESLFAQGSNTRSGACILGSGNTIKGTQRALRYCRELGMKPVVIRDMEYGETLEVLRRSALFVYLPEALEPAGRMPVEARMAGCDVVVNPHVGVAGEPWWRQDRAAAEAFLRDAPHRFWRLVSELESARPPLAQQLGGYGVRRLARAGLAVSSAVRTRRLHVAKRRSPGSRVAGRTERFDAW